MRIRTLVVILVFVLGIVVRGAVSPLPQGNGLAARYPGDAGIASDPAVVFADDFESYTSASGLTSRWSSVGQSANVSITTTTGNFFGGAKALQFTLPLTAGEVQASVGKMLNPERDTLFLRYYSKYDPAFDISGSTHNGGIIWAHYCCPGVKADGFNKFLVSMESTELASTPAPGYMNTYVYHPDQRDGFGDHFFPDGQISPFSTNPPFTFGPDFVPRQQVVPPLGRWNAYELMVKANTPGQRDGRIAMWMDGVLIADFVNVRLRETTSLKIDQFTVGFHINAAHPVVVRKWYDNVVAATSYIGPMVSSGSQTPAPPTNLRIVTEQ